MAQMNCHRSFLNYLVQFCRRKPTSRADLYVRHFASYTDVKIEANDELCHIFRKQREHRQEILRKKKQTFRQDIPLYAKLYLANEIKSEIENASNNLSESVGGLYSGEDFLSEYIDQEFSINSEPGTDLNYGTANRDIPMSDVPCPGCGANLHCQDPGIPGYMPSEKFQRYRHSSEMLKKLECHRCFVWSKYQIALDVSVSEEEYLKVVSELRKKFALLLVVVDLLDIPNSIYEGLLSLVGHKHPLYIVGNKVDLLPKDREGYLDRVVGSVKQHVSKMGLNRGNNIKHYCLVSAKTGYGIEDLVTKLMKDWNRKGDVCVVGCTNSGKSTLFNALLASDYCKSSVRDLIHEATSSIWPGTTLNLLKFPIVTAKPKTFHLRKKRLCSEGTEVASEEQKMLSGNVGITLVDDGRDNFNGLELPTFSFDEDTGLLNEVELTQDHLIESESTMPDDMFPDSKWFYDSPGLVSRDQVINLLTQDELAAVLPVDVIKPRTFVIQPCQALLIGGLARIDYVEGQQPIYYTVFGTSALPITVLDASIADDFYSLYFYTGKLVVPRGDQNRLDQFPALIGQEFTVTGKGKRESAADIQLSSAGWISVTAKRDETVKLRAYTPGGRGCKLRTPSMLPYAVNAKGKRISQTSAFETKHV